MSNKPEKPFGLEYEEAQKLIFNAIGQCNKVHKIPFYMIETMLMTALPEVRALKDKELANARLNYEQSLKAYEEKKEETL